MKTASKTLALVTIGMLAAAGTLGCEVSDCSPEEERDGVCVQGESLTKFNGTPVSKTVDYVPGTPVTVTTFSGNVQVGKSATGKVEVTFEPYSVRGHSKKDQAVEEMNNLILNIDETGGLTITTNKNGGSSGLGTNVQVLLPDGFDGALSLKNDSTATVSFGGSDLEEVRVDYLGASPSVDITNDSGIGNCIVQGAASVTSTNVTCNDDITVLDVADNVNITQKGQLGDVTLRIASVSDTATGGTITNDGGDIAATFPSAAQLSVQALVESGNSVDHGDPPAACTVNEAAPESKTIDCNGGAGALYKLTSTDTFGNITLGYQ